MGVLTWSHPKWIVVFLLTPSNRGTHLDIVYNMILYRHIYIYIYMRIYIYTRFIYIYIILYTRGRINLRHGPGFADAGPHAGLGDRRASAAAQRAPWERRLWTRARSRAFVRLDPGRSFRGLRQSDEHRNFHVVKNMLSIFQPVGFI